MYRQHNAAAEKGRSRKGLRSRFYQRLTVIAIAGIATLGTVIVYSVRWLEVDNRRPSDVILVLGPGLSDARYKESLKLLKEGYGKYLIWSVPAYVRMYGHSVSDLARVYERETASEFTSRMKVCPFNSNEDVSIECIRDVGAHSVLIVTSSTNSGLALSMFRKKYPEYSWRVAVIQDPNEFDIHWWKRREWTKIFIDAWRAKLSWELWEKWKS